MLGASFTDAEGRVRAITPHDVMVVAPYNAQVRLRDVGFLYSRNRLNVAVSWARCLAYLVCSPALLETPTRDLAQMWLVNTLCVLADEAERHSSAPAAESG